MPTFCPPSPSLSGATSSQRSRSQVSERSFQTAGSGQDSSKMDSKIDVDTLYTGDAAMATANQSRLMTNETKLLIQELEERDRRQQQDMEGMREQIRQMMSVVMSLSNGQTNQGPTHPAPSAPLATTLPSVQPTYQGQHANLMTKQKELKWPAAYDHSNSSQWNTTYGLLRYIYKRDVEEKGVLQPSDFFMQLFSHGVAGAAKEMITGQFEGMLANNKISEALVLLEEMDHIFRDRNAEQTAVDLLYACKQFRDESLSSFLPRFQQILARSPSSAKDDVSRSICLRNALNQATKTHMIGRTEPEQFPALIKYLSVMGSQMEQISHIKSKVYRIGQIGIFDDGTRGIAGGRLLGSSATIPSYHPYINPTSVNTDTEGDTKMTGINKIHAIRVPKHELDRRRKVGECLRCGKKGHLVVRCQLLPPVRPESSIKSAAFDEKEDEERENTGSDLESLKD